MHITYRTYTFNLLNPHWPPKQPRSRGCNLLQARMTTSLSLYAITSEILALREARVL
jgi:hypothetical protein